MGKRLGLLALVALVVGAAAAAPYLISLGVFDLKQSSAASNGYFEEDESGAGGSETADAQFGTSATFQLPLVHAAPVTIKTPGHWSWTVLDRRTGAFSGSANFHVVNVSASMIKAWLAADYLRRAAERGA